jgi:hypothetical protein
MNKDEALQKAKLDFLKTHNKEKMLPYYWANMILIGNTDALHLSATHSYFYLWVIGGSIILIVAAFTLRKKFQKNKYSTRKVK